MRLIDADERIELIQKTHCTGCNNYNKVKCRACDIGDMLDYLDEAPTVDQWHYPSRGEYPTKAGNYLIVYEVANALVRSIKFYNPIAKHFDITLPVVVWQHLPDLPPKEEE